MEKHPEYGEQFLFRFPPFRHLGPVVRAHHERWDGLGYPDGLMGRRIPMAARIISVSDVWDALTTDRPWRQAYSFEDAYAFMKEASGTRFDPQVLTPFLRSVRRLRQQGLLD
ncbi:MAG: HD domain-containing phosphohydrolase, partial [Candidatus Eremiobacterota bacterium]